MTQTTHQQVPEAASIVNNRGRIQRVATPDEVAELAYKLWERRTQTSADSDWLEAERLLQNNGMEVSRMVA